MQNSEKQWKEGRYDDDVTPVVSPGDDEYVSDGEGYLEEIDYSQSTFDDLNGQDMEYGDSSDLVYRTPIRKSVLVPKHAVITDNFRPKTGKTGTQKVSA